MILSKFLLSDDISRYFPIILLRTVSAHYEVCLRKWVVCQAFITHTTNPTVNVCPPSAIECPWTCDRHFMALPNGRWTLDEQSMGLGV